MYPQSDDFKTALNEAVAAAGKYSNPEVGTEHILYGLLSADGSIASTVLKEQGVTKEPLENMFENSDHTTGEPEFSVRVKHLLDGAVRLAQANGSPMVGTEHLLYYLLCMTDCYGFDALARGYKADIAAMKTRLEEAIVSGRSEGSGRKESSSQLPAQLKDLGIDITERARQHKIDPIIGRQKEIERIIQILCRKTKNNPVLIGEPGVGKSAVVEGLAKAIVEGNVPELLKNKTIFSLDMGSLMAGTKYRGALEEKLKNAIDVITKSDNIIVFIDELHTLAQAGGKDGEVSPADILKPYLARGEMQTIGATTTDEYRKFIETDKALERRFQPIIVEPPSVEETIEILRGLRDNYEAFHKVRISDEALVAAAKLSDRYIADRFQPDKSIDLIDEAMSRAKVSGNTVPPQLKELEEQIAEADLRRKDAEKRQDYETAQKMRDKRNALTKQAEELKNKWNADNAKKTDVIGEEQIAEIVSSWTKIPVTRLSETETQRLKDLENILHKRVIGQDAAVTSVAKAIRRARAGLKDPNRPVGSFLFLGPTGVGKTELTKALSEAMFDDENAVIRLDMSEYMEAHSVSKLIGSPPGYVGYDEGGQLTEQVRRKPYSVVLFDEIEKAHPDVYNALLQILDDGRLTDAQGRTVSFKNCIIIMTSNVGVSDLKGNRALGFSADTSKADEQKTEDILMAALRRHFKPEFLNRIDVISIFHSLTKEDIGKIADLMLAKVNKSLAEKGITMTLTAAARDYVIEHGYDAEYGARPLRRVIEQTIEDNVAEKLIDGTVKENSRITVDIDKGGSVSITTEK